MRGISPAVLGAMEAGNIHPFYMAAIQFTSGITYLWTGLGTISWNGQSWLGVGSLAGVSAITQTDQLTAENITLSLSSIPSTMVAQAINECQQNYLVQVWLGFLDDNGTIVTDPVRAFSGRLDVPTVQDGGDTCTISITAENPLVDLQRASNRRYTSEDQAIDFPGDKGFDQVPAAQQWNGSWGVPGSTTSNPPPGPGGGGSGGYGNGNGYGWGSHPVLP